MFPALKLFIAFFISSTFYLIPTLALAESFTIKEVTKDNWSAVSQTTFSLDNLMCGSLDLLAANCPYDKEKAFRYMSESGEIKLGMIKNPPVGGAMAGVATLIASLYNPPTSTTEYLAYVGNNLSLTKTAYAQTPFVPGSGVGIIQPVFKIWQVIRNFAYLVFIVIFLAIGFMIMFRTKISQQAVATAQQALPGLVISLILVTFSYFITSLTIDLAFVGVQLVTNIFISFNLPNAFGDSGNLQSFAQNSSIVDIFRVSAFRSQNVADMWNGVGGTVTSSAEVYTIATVLTIIIGGMVGAVLGPWGVFGGMGAGAIVGPLVVVPFVSLLIPLILIVILFIQLLRLFMALIACYIQILVATISGPLIMLFSALPGRGGSFMGWWKNLLANCLVFPAVFAAFLFAGVILADNSNWNVALPLFGGFSPVLLKLIIAYGILIGLPSIPDQVRNAFGIKSQPGIAQAAMAGVTGGIAASGAALGVGRGMVRMGYNTGAYNAPLTWTRNALSAIPHRFPQWLAGQVPGNAPV